MRFAIVLILLVGCSGINYDAFPEETDSWCCEEGRCFAGKESCRLYWRYGARDWVPYEKLMTKKDEAHVLTYRDRKDEQDEFMAFPTEWYCTETHGELSKRDHLTDVSSCKKLTASADGRSWDRWVERLTIGAVVAICVVLVLFGISRFRSRKIAR